MPRDEFRVAIVVSPTRLVDIGILAGDYSRACEWILDNRPVIDDFLQRLQGAISARQTKAVRERS
jgi:uncharacterized membrane protein YcjF (UPF0283 family)